MSDRDPVDPNTKMIHFLIILSSVDQNFQRYLDGRAMLLLALTILVPTIYLSKHKLFFFFDFLFKIIPIFRFFFYSQFVDFLIQNLSISYSNFFGIFIQNLAISNSNFSGIFIQNFRFFIKNFRLFIYLFIYSIV